MIVDWQSIIPLWNKFVYYNIVIPQSLKCQFKPYQTETQSLSGSGSEIEGEIKGKPPPVSEN